MRLDFADCNSNRNQSRFYKQLKICNYKNTVPIYSLKINENMKVTPKLKSWFIKISLHFIIIPITIIALQ